MKNIEEGKIYFFCKGKYIEVPLQYDNLPQGKLRVKHSKVSKTEEKFLSEKEGDIYDEKMYDTYTKRGYSIIRMMPLFLKDQILEDQSLTTISIAPEITKQDADNIRTIFEQIREKYSDKDITEHIYVHDNSLDGPTYYYNSGTNHSDYDNSKEYIQTFLRYKLGELSDVENENIKRYLNFDLRDVFLGANESQSINHRNEAVVMITPNGNRFCATKKKRQHKDEIQEMIRNKLKIDVDDLDVEQLATQYNLILIRIFKTDRNIMVVHCPKEPRSKQIKGFVDFLTELEEINREIKKQGEQPILIAIDGDEQIRLSYERQASVEETKEIMNNYLQLINREL